MKEQGGNRKMGWGKKIGLGCGGVFGVLVAAIALTLHFLPEPEKPEDPRIAQLMKEMAPGRRTEPVKAALAASIGTPDAMRCFETISDFQRAPEMSNGAIKSAEVDGKTYLLPPKADIDDAARFWGAAVIWGIPEDTPERAKKLNDLTFASTAAVNGKVVFHKDCFDKPAVKLEPGNAGLATLNKIKEIAKLMR